MLKIITRYSLFAFCYCFLFVSGCKEDTIIEDERPIPTDRINVQLEVKVSSREVIVETTFYNKSNVTVKIEKWTILYHNMIDWGAFRVMRGKKEVPYIGPMVSRLPPREEDFYDLVPGGSYTSRIKLHNFYDLSRSGTYTVTYEGFWWLINKEGEKDLFFVQSNTVEFNLQKGIPPIGKMRIIDYIYRILGR